MIPNNSFSRIDTFASLCERRYAYEALLGKPPETPEMLRGTQVHAALERTMRAVMAGTELEEAMQRALAPIPPGPLPFLKLQDYLARARPLLEAVKPLRVERRFEGVVGYNGVIDLVSGRVPMVGGAFGPGPERKCVVDYKIISNPQRMKDEYAAKRSLQLQLYCIAEETYDAGFVYLLTSGQVRGTFVTFDDRALDVARLWLAEQARTVARRWEQAKLNAEAPNSETLEGHDVSGFSLAAPGNPLCGERWCPFWSRCIGRKSDGQGYDGGPAPG